MHNARLEYKTHSILRRLKNHAQMSPSTSKRKREKNWTVTRALAICPFFLRFAFFMETMILVRVSGTLQFNWFSILLKRYSNIIQTLLLARSRCTLQKLRVIIGLKVIQYRWVATIHARTQVRTSRKPEIIDILFAGLRVFNLSN